VRGRPIRPSAVGARRRAPALRGRAALPMRLVRLTLPALVAPAALVAIACGGPAEAPGPIRIAELVAAERREPIPIVGASATGEAPAAGEGSPDARARTPSEPASDAGAGPFVVGATPVVQAVDLAAEAVGRLGIRATSAEDGAPLVQLAWRLVGEDRFAPHRALTFPVERDGEEHVYHVDLRREPYWTGRIDALRWQAGTGGPGDAVGTGGSERGLEPAGEVAIAEVTGLPPGDATRVTSLKGVTLPTLPGRQRIEVALPEELPRRAALEARLGLLPRFERPGVAAHFRAWVEDGRGGRVDWLDEEIRGGEGEGWRPVRREVEVPRGGTLVLEVEARRAGRRLSDGSAVWGAPVLVPAAGKGPDGTPELVLLVVVDTLRADVLGSYGGAGGLTPRLDELAARSVRFDDALAPSPWTLPSIATLLTGQPPQVHGAGRRVGDFAPTALGPGLPTLAEAFARRGWYTAAVYNNIYLNPSFGMERGFDEYAWVEDRDDVVVDRALERLAALAGRRTFFLLHLFGPHHPYEPPEAECGRVARAFDPGYAGPLGCSVERTDVPTLSGELPPERDRRWIEGLYRAEVAFADAQLGRLLDGLAELGLAEDTVVLVVSDHGEAFWDRLDQERAYGYEHADHGHAHYRELVQVPAILHRPGLEPRVVEEPVEMVDWMPTLLGLAGIAPPPTAGFDVGPLLAGGPAARRTLLFDALLYGPSRWAARRGPWKLVAPREDGVPDELYDLTADPDERRDLAADRPDVAAALRAYGDRELAERERLRRRLGAGDALESAYLEWNHITKLRSLGYLK